MQTVRPRFGFNSTLVRLGLIPVFDDHFDGGLVSIPLWFD